MHVVEPAATGLASGAATFVSLLFSLNLLLGTFNLIPVPPLDGFGVLGLLGSEDMARRIQHFGRSLGSFQHDRPAAGLAGVWGDVPAGVLLRHAALYPGPGIRDIEVSDHAINLSPPAGGHARQGPLRNHRADCRLAGGAKVAPGLLNVFVQHTSASLTIQENADPDVVHDLNAFFNRLVPEDNRLYRHTVEVRTTCRRTYARR